MAQERSIGAFGPSVSPPFFILLSLWFSAEGMMRFVLFALVFSFAPAFSDAEDRPNGLMWNRSGLAASIPLQIKSNEERDYLLYLRAVGTGEKVLAAYVRGGGFFRVLVPPGRFHLEFAAGADWQGEGELFGAETYEFVLDPPLIFRVGVSRREGHLVDLRDYDDISVRDLATCQQLRLDPGSLRSSSDHVEQLLRHPWARSRVPLKDRTPRYDVTPRFCD